MKGQPAAVSEAASVEADAVLLERDDELNLLGGVIERARSGAGSVVGIEGPPGIGKSRLLEVARELAESEGMDVLSASGRELESEFSFGLALQLFEARLGRVDRAERDRLLSGAARLATPFLADGPRDPLPEGQVFSLLHGLYWLCANLAESRPLMIVIDDAHSADESSLRFMLYLAERIEELPVALVLGYHRGVRTAPEVLEQLAEHPTTTLVRPEPLSAAGVADWLRAALFPKAHKRFSAACHEATGGNPWLLRELGQELAARGVEPRGDAVPEVRSVGPDSIAQQVLLRMRALDPGAVELGRAVAVAGNDSELRHCAAIADLDQADAARLADQLADADILRRSERLAFVQPVVRQAVYAEQPRVERAEAHLKLAGMLESEGAPAEAVADQLLHATRAGNGWAVDALAAGAATALGRGAPNSAVRYLRRALEEPPAPESRAKVMLDLGRAEAIAGEQEAVGRLSAAVEMIADPRQRALTSLDIGRALYAQGRHEDAAEAFRRGATEAGDLDRELGMQLHIAHTLLTRIVGLSSEGSGDTTPAPLAEGIDAEGTATGRVLLAHLALEAAFHGSPRDEVLELSRKAMSHGALLEDETCDGLGYYFGSAALVIAGDLQGAEVAIDRAVEDARARGSVHGFAHACYFRSWARLCQGRVGGAAADVQSALAAERHGWRMGLAGAHAILATVCMERNQLDAARRKLDLGAEAAETSGEMPLPFLLASRAAFLLRHGEPKDALAAHLECGERLEAMGVSNPACIPWRSGAALAYGQLGDRDEAETLVNQELDLARAFGAPAPIGRALFAYGVLLNGDGVELLRESVEVLQDSQATLDRARSLVALGTALRHAGKRRAAREPLREGLDLAERCGSRVLADQAHAEAVVAGIRPRRTALRGVEALTPRELQVIRLAAQGLSNREIAESLFVTVKTIEWHLRHSYDKLEIGSRDELETKLADVAGP